jgi:hypothetical protein
VFPYATFFDMPQLGTEPVRGTGCGADGSLGEAIPDGWWEGFITLGAASLQMDVQCVYYGQTAKPFILFCQQTHTPDECTTSQGENFYLVNNNPRKRSVPLDPSFRRRFADQSCRDPGPDHTEPSAAGQANLDSWVLIVNGRATFALTSCVYS